MKLQGSHLRAFFEKLAERYYEGPELPARFIAQVVEFARAGTHSTEDWARFAMTAVRIAYQAGFVRGHEWQARSLDRFEEALPSFGAEEAGKQMELAVRTLPDPIASQDVQGAFLDRLPDDEARARYLDVLGRYYGNFRVILFPSAPIKKADE